MSKQKSIHCKILKKCFYCFEMLSLFYYTKLKYVGFVKNATAFRN